MEDVKVEIGADFADVEGTYSLRHVQKILKGEDYSDFQDTWTEFLFSWIILKNPKK